jgi:xylan 1,4-beta-xylosidase
MLHGLGDRRLNSDSEDALVTERANGTVVLALWNYAEPGEQKAPKTFHIAGTAGHFTQYREQLLDPDHGSSLKVWKEMGGPVTPTLQQIRKIISDSALPSPQNRAIGDPIIIPSQGLALVELRK